jgi:hypothetical protein
MKEPAVDPIEPAPRRGRRPSRRRAALRGGAALGAAAIIAVTVATLVVNDPLDTSVGTGLGPVATVPPAPSTTGVDGPASAPAPSQTAAGSGQDGGSLGALGALGGSGLDDSVAIGAPAPAATGTPVASSGGAGETPAPAGPDRLTIVSPTLQLLAFGGQIGMPLLCSLAAGTLGPALSDPGVSAVVGQIHTTCVSMANQGADQLRALDDSLTALAAVDPAARSALTGLATELDAAAATQAPFARYLLQISALVRFFYA